MPKYKVSASGREFGTYEGDSEQGARDLCAQDAGYKDEADMVAQLQRPSSLVAALADAGRPAPERCQAGKDGDCIDPCCPQLRDGEPAKRGRHCPLDVRDSDDC